jgi:hypothetical protein
MNAGIFFPFFFLQSDTWTETSQRKAFSLYKGDRYPGSDQAFAGIFAIAETTPLSWIMAKFFDVRIRELGTGSSFVCVSCARGEGFSQDR